jgi:hypothetical protein
MVNGGMGHGLPVARHMLWPNAQGRANLKVYAPRLAPGRSITGLVTTYSNAEAPWT